MADEEKIGTRWQSDELDAIVADYFAMLEAELAGQDYSKSDHSKALIARIGRTHGSAEYKHQNISAVLDELGLPWIRGYVPMRRYQKAILDAIERYLGRLPEALLRVPRPEMPSGPASEVFVQAPQRRPADHEGPESLRRLVKRFDPVERDYRNRRLGEAGEAFVVEVERKRLMEADREDLARLVRWVAREEGDGAGYDVLSFDQRTGRRLIEVKTTNGAARTPFFLSRNECRKAQERPAEWVIYRVHLFATEPRIFTVAPPLEEALLMQPEVWRAGF